MSACNIFVDTNQVLHFVSLEQIDWCALTGCTHCTLVIAPILLRELERKKIFSPSAALKARAARSIDFLVAKMQHPDPILLRSNVTLAFAEREPTIDFTANGLSREVDDDHYIASALERHATSGVRTLIASADGGMALKVRSRPIEILRLPETLRLPDEVDAQQKELREAKREIALLKSRVPKLRLEFPDGSAHRQVRNARSIDLGVPTLAEIRAAHPVLPVLGESLRPVAEGLSSIQSFRDIMGSPSAERIKRYNTALEEYYRRYKRYLSDLAAWTETFRLTCRIDLVLQNRGSATATNVDVTLRFPATVSIIGLHERDKDPEPPEAPTKLNTMGSLAGYALGGMQISQLDYLMPNLDLHDGAAHIDAQNAPGKVHFGVKALKQKCVVELDGFLLVRGAVPTGSGIEVDVEITFNEGEPVLQKMALTFSEVDAPDSDD